MILDHQTAAVKTFLTLDLTQLFRRYIIASLVDNFDAFNVVANRATVAFDVLFTKLGLLYLFRSSQTDCFFLFSQFINTSNFLGSMILPLSYLLFRINLIKLRQLSRFSCQRS